GALVPGCWRVGDGGQVVACVLLMPDTPHTAAATVKPPDTVGSPVAVAVYSKRSRSARRNAPGYRAMRSAGGAAGSDSARLPGRALPAAPWGWSRHRIRRGRPR